MESIVIFSSRLWMGLPLYTCTLVRHTCSPLPISMSLVPVITVIYRCTSLAVNPSTYFCACLPNPDEVRLHFRSFPRYLVYIRLCYW
jgi:hypothetical protein